MTSGNMQRSGKITVKRKKKKKRKKSRRHQRGIAVNPNTSTNMMICESRLKM